MKSLEFAFEINWPLICNVANDKTLHNRSAISASLKIQLNLASQIYSSAYVLKIAFQDDFFFAKLNLEKKSVLMHKCQNVNPNDWHYDLKSDSDVNKRKGLPKK